MSIYYHLITILIIILIYIATTSINSIYDLILIPVALLTYEILSSIVGTFLHIVGYKNGWSIIIVYRKIRKIINEI